MVTAQIIEQAQVVPLPWVIGVLTPVTGAVVAMWVHIRRQEAKYRADVKEFAKDFKDVIVANTESSASLKAAVEMNTQVTKSVYETILHR